jgi:hypothetical protein
MINHGARPREAVETIARLRLVGYDQRDWLGALLGSGAPH